MVSLLGSRYCWFRPKLLLCLVRLELMQYDMDVPLKMGICLGAAVYLFIAKGQGTCNAVCRC